MEWAPQMARRSVGFAPCAPIRLFADVFDRNIPIAVGERCQLRPGRGGVVNVRRRTSTPPADVVIEVANAEELFYADPCGLLAGARRIDSGVDELVERLLAQRRVGPDQRVVLDIASVCPDEQAAKVVAAVRRYCDLRLRRAKPRTRSDLAPGLAVAGQWLAAVHCGHPVVVRIHASGGRRICQ
jgi:hypothetical protein